MKSKRQKHIGALPGGKAGSVDHIGRSNWNYHKCFNNKYLIPAKDGQFAPAKDGQGHWLFLSQKVLEECEGYSIIEITIIPNFEFESLILSYGEQAVIVTDGSVRSKIMKRLNRSVENY